MCNKIFNHSEILIGIPDMKVLRDLTNSYILSTFLISTKKTNLESKLHSINYESVEDIQAFKSEIGEGGFIEEIRNLKLKVM